jgi:hypothetical protein
MKKSKIYTVIILTVTAVFLVTSTIILGSPGGRTGRTLKTSTQGCGGCHGSTFTADVTVAINGPDTVDINQTRQFTMTVSKPSKTGAGLDIATRRGALAPVSNNIHLSGDELTHNFNIPMSGGTVTVTFNYTAPNTSGVDTIWSTGLATNSDGNSSGDDWNWSPNKRLVIRNPVGIQNISSATEFSLGQNYPNPFNPSTSISFELLKEMNIKISVLDIKGSEIDILAEGRFEAGNHTAIWNAGNFASGVYLYRIESEGFSVTKKMVLTK